MRYEIAQLENREKPFVPFKITLTVETHEEYVNFHDNVMPKLTGDHHGSHSFYGDVFEAQHGNETRGKVPFIRS